MLTECRDHHPYWYFSDHIWPEQADAMRDYCLANGTFQKGTTAGESDARNSRIAWFDENRIKEVLTPMIYLANVLAGWNRPLAHSEAAQFTEYKGGEGKDAVKYDWHTDTIDKQAKVVRRLTAVMLLSDPSEYEGGRFELADMDDQGNVTPVEPMGFNKKGAVLVMPSEMYHRVTPVTKGTRYSLVLWQLGLQGG